MVHLKVTIWGSAKLSTLSSDVKVAKTNPVKGDPYTIRGDWWDMTEDVPTSFKLKRAKIWGDHPMCPYRFIFYGSFESQEEASAEADRFIENFRRTTFP